MVTNNGEPMKIDEYVPAAIPTIRAREKCCVVEPPRIYKTTRAISVVNEVLMERVKV